MGVEAFGAWAVEPPQEEVEAMLQFLVLTPRVAEGGEQSVNRWRSFFKKNGPGCRLGLGPFDS